MTKTGVSILLILSLLASSAFGSDEQSEQTSPENLTATVEIENLKFIPGELTVAAGTTIYWINLDQFDHDVTSGVSVVGRKSRGVKKPKIPDDKFSSGLFGKDKTYSFTLEEKGEYRYYCDIHPFMIARIVVE